MRSRSLLGSVIVLICAWSSTAYAQVIGNWEGAMDSWTVDANAPPGTTTAFSATGATLGTQSLKVVPGAGGYQNALRISLSDTGRINDFFDGGTFSVDVSYVAAEWVRPAPPPPPDPDPFNGYVGLHLVVNASSSLGPVIQAVGGLSGGWNIADGDKTNTATFDYTAIKALIDKPTVTSLELIVITNSDPLYTTVGGYYLDKARLEPPPPPLPIVGDWENRTDTWYGWATNFNWDWSTLTGVTLHNYSWKVTFTTDGWENGPVYALEGNDSRIDAFLANDSFSIDVTRLAGEWVTPVEWPYSVVRFIVNAGFSDGTGSIWGDCGDGNSNWQSNKLGDLTKTYTYNYSIYKPTIAAHRSAISWFQLVLITNTAGYTSGFTYYFDNARLFTAPPPPSNHYWINRFNSADEIADPAHPELAQGKWTPPAAESGQPPTTLEWDPLVDADNDAASGAMKVTIVWDPNNPAITSYQSIMTRDMFFPPGLPQGVDLMDYILFTAKVKVTDTSPLDAWGSHGWTNWVFRDIGLSWDQWSAGGNLVHTGAVDANGWMTYTATMTQPPDPVPPRDFFRAITYQIGGTSGDPEVRLDGTMTVWVDNIRISRVRSCHDPNACELCDDGVDNNGDGFVDCADSDCPGTTWCPIEDMCGDGLDDDGDTLIDCADPDCAADSNCAHNDPFADINGDGFVDLDDFGRWQLCFTGAAVKPAPQGCGYLDRDNDGDVDAADLDKFAACASRAKVPANPACDDPP